MATYRKIQYDVKSRHDVAVQSCWIAHVKELNGIPLRVAPNRHSTERVKPCPDRVRPLIEESMRHFGML